MTSVQKCPKEPQSQKKKGVSMWQKLILIKQTITVEPLVICYITAKGMSEPAFKNLELEKACRVNANFNNTVCETIISGTYEEANFTSENNVVQSYVTSMHAWQLITSNLITALVILSLGSCSDHYKIRKLFLLFAMWGQLIEFGGCILCVIFMNQWSLEVQAFAQEIVLAFSGGEKLFLTVIFAYIADVTTPKMRTLRVAVVQAVYNIVFGCGQSISGVLLEIYGYIAILLTGSILCVIGFLYGLLFVKEPTKLENINTKAIILHAINPQHIVQPFKIFSRYKGNCRIHIIVILIIACIYTGVVHGEVTVMFLFSESTYEWTIEDYSFFVTLTSAINVIGLTLVMPLFTKVLQLNDLIIITLSFLNKIIMNIIFLEIKSSLGLYIGCALGILKTLSIVGLRSQLTKSVLETDICKILGLYTIADALSEGLFSTLYNKVIYGYTRTTFPQAFFLLGITLFTIGIVILMLVSIRVALII